MLQLSEKENLWVPECLQDAETLGFDFVVSPLSISETWKDIKNTDGSWEPPMRPEQVMHTMISSQISNQIVGAVSEKIDPDCSLDVSVATSSMHQMKMEMEWANHLTCQACILPFPKHAVNPNFSQCIHAILNDPVSSLSLWIKVPTIIDDMSGIDPWNVWNDVRFQCSHHARLGVVLEIHESSTIDSFNRWLGEPIKAIMIKHSVFKSDGKGYPELPRDIVALLVMAFNLGIQVILDAASLWGECLGTQNTSESVNSIRILWEYISFLFRKQPALPDNDVLEIPYRDFLQAPLQPLQDNLESQTYETFERDSPKYNAYESAIYDALQTPSFSSVQVVVMVVGAGRGPLVAATLLASERAGRDVKVYAVEKNKNAIVHLYTRYHLDGWHGRVNIVHADMRQWNPPCKADVLVSELLGSFGDNELSPECLDGAQKFLKEDGVSIPSSYTSYLSPITAAKAWTEVCLRGVNTLEHFETPFVVRLHSCRVIDDAKPVFEFVHPNRDQDPIDNDRSATIEFVNTKSFDVTCHGFAGYFEAVLHGNILLSIRPETHTEKMHSWFPIFFPVREPFRVPAGATISASMWRRSSSSKVWYEWTVSQPSPLSIHNPNGRSYYVGL